MSDLSQVPTEELLAQLQQHLDPNAKYRAMQKMPGPEDPLSPGYDARQAEKKISEGGWGTGIPKFAYDRGGDVTDLATKLGASPEVAAGSGYVANVLTQAVPALMSSFRLAGAPEKSLTDIYKGAGSPRWLMQSATKPSMAARDSGDADRAIETMLQEGISPTRGGMDKTARMIEKLHGQVEGAIAPSTAEVNVGAVGQKYLSQYEKALQSTGSEDINAVRRVWRQFSEHPGVGTSEEPITVQMAHMLKRGIQQSVGSKNYGELGSAETEASKQLARHLRTAVAEAVPEVAAPLRQESSLMNVREVAANRALMDANKNPLSLGTSIAAIMHDPLAAAGMWANASTPVKAMIARMLYSAGKPSVALPATIAAKEAANQQRE